MTPLFFFFILNDTFFFSIMLLTSLREVGYVFVLSWHSTCSFFLILVNSDYCPYVPWFCFHIIQLQTFSLILWCTANSPSQSYFFSVCSSGFTTGKSCSEKGLEEACARAALLLWTVFRLRLSLSIPTWDTQQWHHTIPIPVHGHSWFRPGHWPTG